MSFFVEKKKSSLGLLVRGGTGFWKHAKQEVSRAEVQILVQVRFSELQVPHTSFEPRVHRQAVLLHVSWKPSHIDRVVGLCRGGLWVGVWGVVVLVVDAQTQTVFGFSGDN